MISFRKKRKWVKEWFPLLCQDAYIKNHIYFYLAVFAAV